MNKEFERELKSLLKKHRIGLQLYCYDMVATLAYDDEDSSDNIICEQEESKYACTVVNDYLDIKPCSKNSSMETRSNTNPP